MYKKDTDLLHLQTKWNTIRERFLELNSLKTEIELELIELEARRNVLCIEAETAGYELSQYQGAFAWKKKMNL